MSDLKVPDFEREVTGYSYGLGQPCSQPVIKVRKAVELLRKAFADGMRHQAERARGFVEHRSDANDEVLLEWAEEADRVERGA